LAALSTKIGQLALDKTNGDLYIADTGNSAIRKVEYSTGIITTVAGGNLDGYAGTFCRQCEFLTKGIGSGRWEKDLKTNGKTFFSYSINPLFSKVMVGKRQRQH
jgi:hypothetical protein